MKANAVSCVNTLASAHEDLSPVFAGMTDHTMEARLRVQPGISSPTSAPVLDGALVAFDCRIDQIVEVGTHDVFICSVEAVEVGTVHEGLIYYARGYHRMHIRADGAASRVGNAAVHGDRLSIHIGRSREQRKRITDATSAGWPYRFSGISSCTHRRVRQWWRCHGRIDQTRGNGVHQHIGGQFAGK